MCGVVVVDKGAVVVACRVILEDRQKGGFEYSSEYFSSNLTKSTTQLSDRIGQCIAGIKNVNKAKF